MLLLPDDSSGFAPYFHSCQAQPANNPTLMQSVFALRYQVYCEECAFLPPAQFLTPHETDSYDKRSVHFCAFNLADELVGYVRLVLAEAEQPFPFQSHCQLDLAGYAQPVLAQSAEISRLMVRQDYRRRRHDNLAGVTVDNNDAAPEREKRRNTPQILLSLYRQMYAYSLGHGIRYWYAAMEPPLARVLMRMSFAFVQVGPPTDYYGLVAPYLADLRDLEIQIGQKNPPLLAWLRQGEAVRRPH